MPAHLTEAYSDDSGSSGKQPYSHQSSWMPCLNRFARKHGSLIVPHSQTLCKEERLLHHKKKRLCTGLNLSSNIPSYIRAQNLGKDGSDSDSFGLSGQNALAQRILMDPSCNYETNSQGSRKRNLSSTLILATDGSDLQAQSDKDDPLKTMVMSTHFRNSNFAMPGDGSSTYEKFSAILVQEGNGLSAVLSRGLGNPPLFSQAETRSFFITKRARADVDKQNHHGGVKIQPLWSSTDSDNDSQTPKGDINCELLAAETVKTMDVDALSNNSFGVVSPSLVKVSQDETPYTATVEAKDDKGRGKLPKTTVMDSMEASSSRTQSLEVEQLLSCTKQPCESKTRPGKKEAEPSNRWVKRLKPSSSEVGESPAHTPSPDPEQSMMKGESCSRKDAVFQSSWIQRWCQEHTVAKHRRLRKGAVVTCEPDSSKVPLDELEKKQFPSIAAMALMGKSMSGFRPCKLTKRGPLVIWNTEDT